MIEDKLAIYELNAKYFWAVDYNNIDDYLNAWHQEGISENNNNSVKGHENLKHRFLEMQKSFSKNKRHIVSNIVIDLNGDQAKQKCYLTVLERKESPKVIATASYNDILVKTESGWKFLKRVIEIDPNFSF